MPRCAGPGDALWLVRAAAGRGRSIMPQPPREALKQRLDRFLRAGAEGILAVLIFACVANYLTAEGIQDNQLALVEGFLLGIVASGIAWRVAEYMVQPSLEIVVDMNRARVGE